MIQNLVEYYSFVKERVFEHLSALFSRKLQSQATYCRALAEMGEEAEGKARAIEQFAAGRPHCRQWLAAYARFYLSLQQELRGELQQIELGQQQREQAYLYVLDSCKASHLASQKQVIEHAQKQLSEAASKIGQRVGEIGRQQAAIDGLRFESFSRMLEILKEFDEETIREKYMQGQSEKNFKLFGSRRREMNERLDEVGALDQEIKAGVSVVREIEKQREHFCLQVCEKLNQIESDKLDALYRISSAFRSQFAPLDARLDYRELIDFPPVELPLAPNRQFLQNYKKSIYLLLNPHPQNQLLLEHRQSLASELSLSALTDSRKGQVFEVGAEGAEGAEGGREEAYNGYVEFIYRVRSTMASAYHSEEELGAFYDFFGGSVRRKALREVFLFYLYELGKMEGSLMGLACKEGAALVRMLQLFLSECLALYDSQSAIKALMLLYHVRLPGSPELHLAVRTHSIWKCLVFWETSFLESVYEYFEMVVIYYHGLVESQAEKGPPRSSNWFASLLHFFPKPSEKKKPPQDALKDFYHEIVQNLTVIYLANMVMMHVPHAVVDSFKRYVLDSAASLSCPPELNEHLRSLMQAVCSKSEKSVKRLLTKESVLDRVMSKLIGTNEEKRESVPLSKSIADWLDDR